MDLTEHQDLTSIIKGVHEKLRKSLMTTRDSEKVWADHVKDEELRKKYSQAMYKLATDIWKDKETRIEWTYETCINYFFNGGLDRSLLRHKKITDYRSKEYCYSRSFEGNKYYVPENNYKNLNRKLNLLDVGSCYNPFSKFTEFNCTAIDLTPATMDVLQVDFLYLDIKHKHQNNSCDNNQSAELFLEESFDIVVLSLVLEYLPHHKQRLLFCYKSWQLLQENGLLIIITPDSKSVNHNTDMMKSWKLALEKIGFFRVKYEKLKHVHCMAFRKLRKDLNEIINFDLVSQLFYIPQDFKTYSKEEYIVERNEEENIQICNNFLELPKDCLF